MNQTDLFEAVRNGNRTREEIADALGKHPAHMGRVLKRDSSENKADAVRDGKLYRERDGRTWMHYAPDELDVTATPEATEVTPADDDSDGLMPLGKSREEYDHAGTVPQDIPEYIEYDGELSRILALVDVADELGISPHVLVDGPTGCGKTTLAENVAKRLEEKYGEAAYYSIQMSDSTREADLLGSPSIVGGETRWVDEVLTKALLSSQERPTVLLVDEANRAQAKAKGALFSALDHRATITLNGGRGGEVIAGNPKNLVVIATINEGDEYHGTYDMDAAEKRRFGNRYSVDYIGYGDEGTDEDGNPVTERRDREARLIADRTPIPFGLAQLLVDTSNEVRKRAEDPTNMDIAMGIPTDALLSWARTAYAYGKSGVENPVVVAAEDAVIKPYYAGSKAAVDEASSLIYNEVDDAPVEPEEFALWNSDESFVCDHNGGCGYTVPRTEGEELGLDLSYECPECGGGMSTVGF